MRQFCEHFEFMFITCGGILSNIHTPALRFLPLGICLFCGATHASSSENIYSPIHTQSTFGKLPVVVEEAISTYYAPISISSDAPLSANRHTQLYFLYPETLSGNGAIHVSDCAKVYFGRAPYHDLPIKAGIYRLLSTDENKNSPKELTIRIENEAQAYTAFKWKLQKIEA